MKNKKPSISTTTFTSSPSSLLSHSLTLPLSSLKTLIHSLSFSPSSPLPSLLHSSLLSSLSPNPNPSPLHSPSNSPPPKKSRLDSLNPIKTLAYLTRLLFSHPDKPFAPNQLLPCVQALHDSLVLFENDESLLFQVSSLCEDWWKGNLEGKEKLIAQSLPYFLARSLMVGKKSDVRRVFGLREAFAMFDYEDESIDDVKMLFLRCVIAPIYIKIDEGRKFISFLFSSDEKLAKEILVLIKSQIPIGKKSVLVAYGEIIFRVWKGGENEGFVRGEVERFLQDLIEGAIYAKSRVLGVNIRRVLGGFIDQRTVNGVEKLLFRLAEPILFRSLQVANCDVRCNALNLFIDLFPILDPDSTREEKDMLLEKQLFFMEKLLVDFSPEIRSLSIEGLFKILHLFWEIIPSTTIAKLLTKVFDEMSLDSCNEIRVSCLNGAKYLVQNPLSHEILKVLLAKLGRMVLDPALSVRVAFVDLLLAVRDIKSLQFNKIVGLDSLLSLLANDQTRVAQKITKLLLPTYFPVNLPLQDSYTRCISLIKRHPSAGARFCEFLLSEGSSVKSLVQLIKVSLAFSLSKEKGLDQEQTDCLIIAVSNVINSLANNEGNFSDLDPVKGTITVDKLKVLMGSVLSDKAREAILNIASALFVSGKNKNNSDLIKLRDICMEIIFDNSNGVFLSENNEKQRVLLAAQKLIFELKSSDFLFEKMADVLDSSVSGFNSVSRSNKKAKRESKSRISKSGSQFPDSKSRIAKSRFCENSVSVAWQVMEILRNEETKNAVLESRFSEKIFSCLKVLARVFVEQGVQFEKLDVTSILAYLNYAMCVCNFGSSDVAIFDDSLDHILNSLCQLLDKFISDKKGASEEIKWTENMIKLCTSVLKFLLIDIQSENLIKSNMLKCLNFASKYTKYISSTLKKNPNPSLNSENSKEVLLLLKSSFTYCSKLLNLFIIDSEELFGTGTEEAYYLTNNILNLVPIEIHFGTKNASIFVPIAKDWLPVFLLGLGCTKLFVPVNNTAPKSVQIGTDIPLWVSTLAEFNLERENEEASQEEGNEITSDFEKFTEKFVKLLKKGNPKLLDVVGSVLVSFIEAGLEKMDFKFVFGLTRFLCVKLFDNLEKFELTRELMQDLLSGIEKWNCDPGFCEEGNEMMENITEMIRSVLVSV